MPNVNGNTNRELALDDMPIIGTKTFAYDDAFLNDHVARTLEWWYGHRDPQGVSLKDSRRCLLVTLMILVGTFCLPHCQYLVRASTSQAVSGESRKQWSFERIQNVIDALWLDEAGRKSI